MKDDAPSVIWGCRSIPLRLHEARRCQRYASQAKRIELTRRGFETMSSTSLRIRWPISGRRRVAALVALAALLTAAPARAFNPPAGDYSKAHPLDVRIMAYNTFGRFITDSGADPEFNRIFTALQPDIISFEEIPSSLTTTQMTTRLNSIMPIGGAGWQVQFGLLGGTRNVIASRYALSLKRTDTVPVSSTRGVCIALADLPNATHPIDVYLLSVHLKCCGDPGGSEDASRQRSADAIANWLADARGVARSSGNNVVLPANTPMIVLGDFNLVGGPQPENTLITGNIQNEGTFGSDVKGDWDISDLVNLNPLDPFTGNNFTWQGNGQFAPSPLDRFMVTDSAFTVANKFVLNTATMTPAALAAAGLQAGDTLEANTSDHLPIVVDLRVAIPCAVDNDGDVNGDSAVNGADVQPFVAELLGSTAPSAAACAADIDDSGAVTSVDAGLLASLLLQ